MLGADGKTETGIIFEMDGLHPSAKCYAVVGEINHAASRYSILAGVLLADGGLPPGERASRPERSQHLPMQPGHDISIGHDLHSLFCFNASGPSLRQLFAENADLVTARSQPRHRLGIIGIQLFFAQQRDMNRIDVGIHNDLGKPRTMRLRRDFTRRWSGRAMRAPTSCPARAAARFLPVSQKQARFTRSALQGWLRLVKTLSGIASIIPAKTGANHQKRSPGRATRPGPPQTSTDSSMRPSADGKLWTRRCHRATRFCSPNGLPFPQKDGNDKTAYAKAFARVACSVEKMVSAGALAAALASPPKAAPPSAIKGDMSASARNLGSRTTVMQMAKIRKACSAPVRLKLDIQ